MQALVFMIFMIIIFGMSIFCVIFGCVARFWGKRTQKKWAKHIGIIVLCVGIVASIIPISWFTTVRSANGMVDEEYVDTGIMIRWGSHNTFKYEGEEYRHLDLTDEDEFSYADNQRRTKESAAFNICRKGILESIFNANEKQVIYQVENGVGVTMYSDGYDIYYPVKEEKKVLSFYKNFYNYEWYYCEYDKNDNEVLHKLSLTKQEIDWLERYKESEDTEEGNSITIRKVSPDGVYAGELYCAENIIYE